MKCLYDSETRNRAIKANIILFISCMILCILEFIFLLPTYISLELNIKDIFLIAISSLGFYSFFYFITLMFIDIIILASFYTKSKLTYYHTICLLILTIINYIPASITLNYVFIDINVSQYLIILLSWLISFSISVIISSITAGSYKELNKTLKKYTFFIAFFLIFIIIFTLLIVKIMFQSNIELISYYLILSFIFCTILTYNLLKRIKIDILERINYLYIVITGIIFILITVSFFPYNYRIEAYVKRYTLYEKSIIANLSMLLDFDKDGFGPEYIVGGGDTHNNNPDFNGYAFDYPENNIDRNIFNGDLYKQYNHLSTKRTNNNLNLSGYNVVLITINNIDAEELNKENTFISNLKMKGIWLENMVSISPNKIDILNGLLTSNISGAYKLARKKSLFPPGKDVIDVINNNNYYSHIFLDIPYSSIKDLFGVLNRTDTFYANNNTMLNPATNVKIADTLDLFNSKPYFCWIYIDNKIPVDINKRVESIFNSIGNINNSDKTIFMIVFIPTKQSIKNNKTELLLSALIYYTDSPEMLIKKPVSSMDILPTILDMLNIKYNRESYTGYSLFDRINSSKKEDLPVFSFDSLSDKASVLSGRYKLIYTIKDNYYEIYDTLKDSEERNNIINENKPEFKILFNWLDFFLSNGQRLS